jgi:class 3 adenylate cyclase
VPIYIDRHDLRDLTPEEVADAHVHDVDVQARYGVRFHTYWFDPTSGSVFCLVEGPTKEAVEAVHQETHGRLAGMILEIDPGVPLNVLLGAFPAYPTGAPFEAPVMRAILFTDLCGSVEQTSRIGDLQHHELVLAHDRIMRRRLARHCGRAVKHTGDGIMAAFTSAGCAVTCAIEAQRAFHDHNADNPLPLEVKIGISAGEPVTDEKNDLFGASVQLAARLCASAAAGEIAVSLVVRELCLGKRFRFQPRKPLRLQGIPEPTAAYRVVWRAATRGAGVEDRISSERLALA